MLAAAVVFMFSCGKHNEKKSDKHEHTTVAQNKSSHDHSHDGHDHSAQKHEEKKSDAKSTAKSTEHKNYH